MEFACAVDPTFVNICGNLKFVWYLLINCQNPPTNVTMLKDNNNVIVLGYGEYYISYNSI